MRNRLIIMGEVVTQSFMKKAKSSETPRTMFERSVGVMPARYLRGSD